MGFSDSVIIFHPGSRHLYLGRATDPHPCKILQLIARRRYDSLPDSMTPSTPHHDSLFPKSVSMSSHEPLPPEVETAKLQLSLLFQSSSFHAASSKTASNPPSVPRGDTNVDPNLSFHIGDQVIHLTSSNSWNIHCPWRRGALNLHRGIGGSLTSVLQDLEDIWLWSLKNLLHINPATLKDFRAILVIPVMFDRSHTNHLANLLLNRLGFQACILVQDHVCASFGAGLSCCTVVDVGDQKLSVSCVEDAISYPQSRLTLNYGGGDLTFSLARILLDNNHIQIPPSISSFDLVHWEFLTWLKESRCHLHLSASSSTSLQKETLLWNEKEYNIQWPKPPPDIRNIIPLAYFNPDLLGASVPKKGGVMYWVQQPAIPDDPHNPVQQDLKPSPSKKRAKNKEPEQDAEPILAIDKAILQSIEKCNVADDLKRRLFSCVLVCGGGFQFDGLSEWLQDRLQRHTPRWGYADEGDLEPGMEVIPKVISSCKIPVSTVTWKGAAILSSLDTAKDLWITRHLWDKAGGKYLREKSLFHY